MTFANATEIALSVKENPDSRISVTNAANGCACSNGTVAKKVTVNYQVLAESICTFDVFNQLAKVAAPATSLTIDELLIDEDPDFYKAIGTVSVTASVTINKLRINDVLFDYAYLLSGSTIYNLHQSTTFSFHVGASLQILQGELDATECFKNKLADADSTCSPAR